MRLLQRWVLIALAVSVSACFCGVTQASYVASVSADNPKYWYRFEDASSASGQPAADTGVAPVLNGTYGGTVTLNASPLTLLGNYGAFGSGEVNLGNTMRTQLHGAPAVTIEAWINTSGWVGGQDARGVVWNYLGDNVNATTGAAIGVVRSGSNYDLQVFGRSQFSDVSQSSLTSITSLLGTWIHVVGVLDYANDKILTYINGSQVGNVNATFGANSYTTGTSTINTDAIGSWRPDLTDRRFVGAIDEVAIYDYALSAPQVLAHYNAAVIPEPSSLALLAFGMISMWLFRRR